MMQVMNDLALKDSYISRIMNMMTIYVSIESLISSGLRNGCSPVSRGGPI